MQFYNYFFMWCKGAHWATIKNAAKAARRINMKKQFNYKKILLCAGVLCGALYAAAGVHGKGKYVSYEQNDLPPFSSVRVQAQADVTFMQSSNTHVQISGPENLVKVTRVFVQEDTLYVTFTMPLRVRGKDEVKVAVYAPQLNTATVEGRGTLTVHGMLSMEKLSVLLYGQGKFSADGLMVNNLQVHAQNNSEAELNRVRAKNVTAQATGQADIELSGIANHIDLRNEGAGEIEAADLRAPSGEATLKGRGDIYIAAFENLKASAYGKGRIYYKGSPVSMQREGNIVHVVQDYDD